VPDEAISALQWTWFKKRLSFCEVTQDGDEEGCYRLHRLPTAAEADEIRDIVGLRKRKDLSAEAVVMSVCPRLWLNVPIKCCRGVVQPHRYCRKGTKGLAQVASSAVKQKMKIISLRKGK